MPDTCVRVDVFRNQAGGNPLPTFFGRLVGVNDQGVRATATAQIVTGDTTDCLKPWAVVDAGSRDSGRKGPIPLPTSTFDRYSTGRGSSPPQENDVYRPPTASDPGTGFTLPADEGRRFAIKTSSGQTALSSGWFMEIRLRATRWSQRRATFIEQNITTCGGLPSSFAAPGTVCPSRSSAMTEAAYWAERGCYRVLTGNRVGPTGKASRTSSPAIRRHAWVNGTGIVGSTFDPPTTSPRVVPIGVIDIDDYLSRDPNGSNGVLRMVEHLWLLHRRHG